MKYLVISYSHTGNNALLAKGLAEKIGSDFIELRETKKRRILTILLDIIFKRTPEIYPLQKELENYDYIIFVAPVWFGKIATPFRQLFKLKKDVINNYAFVSLSAGTGGIAPTVDAELQECLKTSPKAVVHHLISDLVPYDQRENHKLLTSYKLKVEDAGLLIDNTTLEIQNSTL